jgi:hypothetical protein
MYNRYSGIIKRKEIYCGPQSPQGLELFVKYEDMELHLETLVSVGEINQEEQDILWGTCTWPTYASIRQMQRGKFDQFCPGGKTSHAICS